MTTQPWMERLLAAGSRPRIILGLMSGTSLDGLDMALCHVTGHGPATSIKVEKFKSVAYQADEKARLIALAFREQVSLADLTVANVWLADLHGRLILAALQEWGMDPAEVDCIASHGQTLFHAPSGWTDDQGERHATLQIGDGDHLARATGILTLSDFRQKEIAAGGQGAPLAPYAEALIYSGENPRLLLNLGGIANFTWLPAKGSVGNEIHFGDTGPANTLMDRTVREYFPRQSKGYDPGGELAAQGEVHPGLLAAFKSHPYFSLPCPKSTGPETFGENFLKEGLAKAGIKQITGDHTPSAGTMLNGFDLLATLCRLTADSVVETLGRELPQITDMSQGEWEVVVSGGGSENITLMRQLREALPQGKWPPLEMVSDPLGITPESKEAVLFAVLANESLWGEGVRPLHQKTGKLAHSKKPMRLGKLSWPE